MATAGSVVIDLLMKTGSFETDTKRAEKALRELQKEAQAMAVAVGAAFAAVAGASAAMVKSAIDTADEMGKMAQKVGTSVEALSALAYAADLAGIEHEQLTSAMVKLSKNMSDAANGTGDAAEAFKALGINVKNADGSLKSSDQVLTELAEKFSGYRDGAEKTALAVAIFGKAGADLIPLLNSGAQGIKDLTDEARKLGVVIDEDTRKAAEEFNDNLSRMGYAVKGVANTAAKELLPVLTAVSQMFVDLAKDETAVSTATGIVKAAVGGLVNVFQAVAVVGSDVGFVFLSVGREIGAWAAQLAALARGDWQGFRAISDAVKEDGARARAELDKFQSKVMSLGQGGDFVGPPAPAGGGGGPPAPGGGGKRITSDKFSAADALARETEILNEAQEAWAKYNKAQEVGFSTTYTEADAAAREAEILNEVMQLTAKELEKNTGLADEFGNVFGNALQSLVISGDSFSDVIKNMMSGIANLILQIGVIEPMMERLRAAMKAGGGLAGFLSSIGGAIGGGGGGFVGPPAPTGGARAAGGPVSAGVSYLVGERGPERFVPRMAGMVVPNGGSASGGPTIINQTRGRVDNVVQQELPGGGRALILQELASEFANPNSKVSRSLQTNYRLRPAR